MSRKARRDLNRLKSILRSQYAADPITLREWKSVSRIERSRSDGKAEQAPAIMEA